MAAAIVFVLPAAEVATASSASSSLAICQKTLSMEAKKLAAGIEKALSACLQSLTTEVLKKGLDADPERHLGVCIKQFRSLNDSRHLGKSLPEKFRARVLAKCDPANNDHTLEDILGPDADVDEPIGAGALGGWCVTFGGSGAVASVEEWLFCVEAASECDARDAVAARFPRSVELLTRIGPSMVAVAPPANDPVLVYDAHAGLMATLHALDRDSDLQLDAGGACPPPSCPPGETRDATSNLCGPCAPGTANATGDGPCLPCPAGSYAQSGANTCTPCAVGSFAAAEGLEACTPCAAGSYAPATGSTVCQYCSAGTFAAATGATACTDCAAGSFAAQPGRSECEPCSSGTFAASAGRSSCDSCAPGTYQSGTGATACEPCEPGMFAAATGRTSCDACAAGTFIAGSARRCVGGSNAGAACTSDAACPDGACSRDKVCAGGTTPGTACASDAACGTDGTCVPKRQCSGGSSAGSVCSSDSECPGDGVCIAPGYGRSSCDLCPPGSFTGETGSIACQLCGIGEFAEAPGRKTCSSCPANTYAYRGSPACYDCPATGVTCIDGDIRVSDDFYLFRDATEGN